MGALKTVMVHQTIRITTITVVTIMICRAFSLDSWMPWMFFHQKYSTIRMAKPAEKWSSEKVRGWWTYLPISSMKHARYCPAETALMGPVSTKSNSKAYTENLASVPPMASLTTRYTPPRTNMLLVSI